MDAARHSFCEQNPMQTTGVGVGTKPNSEVGETCRHTKLHGRREVQDGSEGTIEGGSQRPSVRQRREASAREA